MNLRFILFLGFASNLYAAEPQTFEFTASGYGEDFYLKIALDDSGKRSANGFQFTYGDSKNRDFPVRLFERTNVDWLFWLVETKCEFWELPEVVGDEGLDGYTFHIRGIKGRLQHEVSMWSPKNDCYKKLSDYLFIMTGRKW